MVKNEVSKASGSAQGKKKVLITQPRPESDKSPYFELCRKYNVELEFHPFIRLEPIAAKEFRKQKIDIQTHTAVIFTSRNAIDHFFRMCDEMRVSVSQDTKYFCITEAVDLEGNEQKSFPLKGECFRLKDVRNPRLFFYLKIFSFGGFPPLFPVRHPFCPHI